MHLLTLQTDTPGSQGKATDVEGAKDKIHISKTLMSSVTALSSPLSSCWA